ncbi:unnamed protein product [Ambrosiozyma monospora]|uniref:Unnamed protein product n=1 Tax=Ambrosiozyma monospora TaxID=43982 RepID=A0A9W6Z041_AMBMO|nr:unnamed protein product [Ambrosiozyma monospora]
MLHTVYNQQINKYIRVEVIYENYPVIAGTDELSVILRFRYVGPLDVQPKPTQQSPKKTVLNQHERQKSLGLSSDPGTGRSSVDSSRKTSQDNGGGWFGGRLSKQLSSATRSLFLQQLDAVDEKHQGDGTSTGLNSNGVGVGAGAGVGVNKVKKHETEVYLGFTQVLGYYTLNDKIIDTSIFEDLQRQTVIGGKLAGINGLTAPLNVRSGPGGGSVGGGLGGVGGLVARGSALGSLFNTELGDLGTSDAFSDGDLDHLVPFYSTGQSILFSDIQFNNTVPESQLPAQLQSQKQNQAGQQSNEVGS